MKMEENKRKEAIPADPSPSKISRFKTLSGEPLNRIRSAQYQESSTDHDNDVKIIDILKRLNNSSSLTLQELTEPASQTGSRAIILADSESESESHDDSGISGSIILFVPGQAGFLITLCDHHHDEEDEGNHKKKKKKKDERMKGVVESIPLKDVPVYAPMKLRCHGEPSSFRCNICSYAIPPPLIWSRIRCQHTFCKECIRDYVMNKFQEGVGRLECPETKCKSIIEPSSLERIIPGEVIRRWVSSLQEGLALEVMEEIICPFGDCRSSFMDDMRKFLIRACPSCWRIFCMSCKVAWHLGMHCSEFKRLQWFKGHTFMQQHFYGNFWRPNRMLSLAQEVVEIVDSDSD